MRFSALTTMAPGDSLAEQCRQIAAGGCLGVETIIFPNTPLERWQADLRTAADDAGLEISAVILGGLALYRAGQLRWIREAFQAIAELKGAVLMTAEYQAQNPLPIFPPYPGPAPVEQSQLERSLAEISHLATTHNVQVFLEPVTQFESRIWTNVDSVLAVCCQLDNPNIQACLDLHNINITEAGIVAAIKRAGPWLGHLHLADNNRRLPGQGHLDFKACWQALNDLGYSGWYTFECGVEGEFASALQTTIRQLQTMSTQAMPRK